jgi:hypothetical protein
MDVMHAKGAGVVAAEMSFHHPKFIMNAYYPDVDGMAFLFLLQLRLFLT